MKFSITAALLLLPATILAVPAAESSTEQCQVIKAISCKVINISAGTTANCRTGPGTDYPVAKKVDAGSKHAFSCYKKGECVNGNCTWDQLHYDGGSCFLSGSLTDSSCSIAALGPC
ncbi:hypothetical protein V499_09396 [Pseudogymnoascus sp. VKM F-103]|uniref:Uncharacterized protein n=1 Tax=Pseudogymnoascus verrucosus TaxID=342668 RepID=A0A1B8GLI7_9PEZI|nr:uncharacterized protein VE01_04154 [Pseudogymnoascus verrucosus]KFY70175.1 hypothetical protein V499_09396 [Pseudogymnoascus sp. VKM F-103]OBT96703.1 hypothetical protein VE01_04154 [Pseudogymnoascus verrucosus]